MIVYHIVLCYIILCNIVLYYIVCPQVFTGSFDSRG